MFDYYECIEKIRKIESDMNKVDEKKKEVDERYENLGNNFDEESKGWRIGYFIITIIEIPLFYFSVKYFFSHIGSAIADSPLLSLGGMIPEKMILDVWTLMATFVFICLPRLCVKPLNDKYRKYKSENELKWKKRLNRFFFIVIIGIFIIPLYVYAYMTALHKGFYIGLFTISCILQVLVFIIPMFDAANDYRRGVWLFRKWLIALYDGGGIIKKKNKLAKDHKNMCNKFVKHINVTGYKFPKYRNMEFEDYANKKEYIGGKLFFNIDT